MTPPASPPKPDSGPEVVNPSTPRPPQRKSGWKVGLFILLFCVLAAGSVGVGILMRAIHAGNGEIGGAQNPWQEAQDLGQVAIDPKAGFAGKDKIVIACMGIDDNWTNSDEVYTVASRTDTLFLLTLNMVSKKVTMLSIPRDSYVQIAGTDYSSKINSAYATGGPKRTELTIQQWLGVDPDYYIVLNIDATKKMVDALGGVDVNVEHQMDYDDQWGHLHVHLKPGFQHLDGDDAVGFARYRHGNRGISPEDGDERRMYRQHILMRSMMDKAKSFATVLQANNLVDTGMQSIRTDMTRTQLFDLAAIFHKVGQDDVTTASLVGEDGRGPNGVYVMKIDDREAALYVDWLVKGDENAGKALTPVDFENATTTNGLAARAEMPRKLLASQLQPYELPSPQPIRQPL